MGIEALPTSTIRALGASQVVNDPAVVIKELLDNALDARATSISVEISNNTVDSIQVRDNGHGIPPDDRLLVARPHCTSKIASHDDLLSIGGTSLGFRGEALASIADMSGSFVISTRVEGEQVAVALKIDQQGEVVGQDRASMPVGTTVKITDFVKAYPVRKQNALKNSDKCLKKIKLTLQSYAFARPHVRLSLRVLKAKNDSSNWTYAPKANGTVEDAALKIVGVACTSHCTTSVLEEHGFTLHAFLPKIDAAPDKISNIGPFFSVDGRPISASRGTPKQIVKTFRETLKKANSNFEEVKNPFLYLEITCPTSAYDANIEPAKDDVLFEDATIVVEAARRLFQAVYPVPETSDPETKPIPPAATNIIRKSKTKDKDDFTTSLELPYINANASRRSMEEIPEEFQDHDPPLPATNAEIESENNDNSRIRYSFRSTMYGCDEEDLDLLDARPSTGRTIAELEHPRQIRKDINLSNPWMMAKMNAASQQLAGRQQDEYPDNTDMSFEEDVNSNNSHRGKSQRDPRTFSLPTPRPSSPTRSSQRRNEPVFIPDSPISAARGFPREPLLPVQAFPDPISPFRNGARSETTEQATHQSMECSQLQSVQINDPSSGTPLHSIPNVNAKPRRNAGRRLQQTKINKPFKPPAMADPERGRVWFENFEDKPSRPKKRQHPRADDGLVVQGDLGDLVEDPRPLTPPKRNRDMRDFVTYVDLTGGDPSVAINDPRNAAQLTDGHARNALNDATDDKNANGRGFTRASEMLTVEDTSASEQMQPLAKRKRRASDSRALRELSNNSLAPDDDDAEFRPTTNGRALSRRSTGGNRVRRTKSSLLPLERVPVGKATHNVIFKYSTSGCDISRLVYTVEQQTLILGWTERVDETRNAFHLDVTPAEIQYLTAKLHNVLLNRLPDGEFVQDLGKVVQKAFAMHQKEMMNVGTICA